MTTAQTKQKNPSLRVLQGRSNLVGIATALGLAMTSFFMPLPVQAQTSLGISAIPPRVMIDQATPGSVVTQTLKVRNESAQTQYITVSTKDFIVQDNEGTPIFLSEDIGPDQNRWAASLWLQVSPTSLKLDPGQTKTLVLTAIIPDDATPGGHYAAVFYTPDTNATITGTGSLITTNVGSLVYLSVPGDIQQSALIQQFTAPKFLEFGPVDFSTTIQNLSDIHITPIGSIQIKNWLGGKTASLPLETLNIFPQTSRSYQNTLDRKWLFGRYQAQLTAAYGTTGQALLATLYFWVIPWRLLVLLAAALIIIILLITIIRRRRPSNPVEIVSQQIEDLKNKYKDR